MNDKGFKGRANRETAHRHRGEWGSAPLLQVAEDIIAPTEVTVEYHDDGVQGIAWVADRKVLGPRPMSRRRLSHLVFLVGQVVEVANAPTAASLQFKAWRWTIRAVEQQGVRVPRRVLKEAKRSVAYELHRQVLRGGSEIDLEAAAWSEPYLSLAVKAVYEVPSFRS